MFAIQLRRIAQVITLACATAGVPQFASAQSPDAVAEVIRFQKAATDAYQRNDAVAIDSLLADDFTLTDSRGVITTKYDDMKAARAGDVVFSEFRNVGEKVRFYGNTAVVTGRTIVRGVTRGGTKIDQVVAFTDTNIRVGGRWRMVSSHASPIANP